MYLSHLIMLVDIPVSNDKKREEKTFSRHYWSVHSVNVNIRTNFEAVIRHLVTETRLENRLIFRLYIFLHLHHIFWGCPYMRSDGMGDGVQLNLIWHAHKGAKNIEYRLLFSWNGKDFVWGLLFAFFKTFRCIPLIIYF